MKTKREEGRERMGGRVEGGVRERERKGEKKEWEREEIQEQGKPD